MDWVEMDPHEVSGFTDPTADKDAHAELLSTRQFTVPPLKIM